MKRIGSIQYDPKVILGRGACGTVFPGTFQERRVAVKRMTLEDVNKREEGALNSLMTHPNVIKLLRTETDEDFKYFTLELCAASMDDVFNPSADNPKYKGPLPSELDTLLQLSEGLQYIHEKKFVHRDVKPGNVLISYPRDDGTVVMKWADFGLSKPVSIQKTFSVSGLRGTMSWIAPEILEIVESDANASEKNHGTVESDTWSAGCLLFFSLTKGKHPFGEHTLDIIPNMKKSNPERMKELSQDHFAFHIINGMIKKDPAERTKLIDVVKILNKIKLENELQELCSRSLEEKEHDRIAALLQVGVDPNISTNSEGQTPLLLCLAHQDGQSRLKCLKILLEGNKINNEGGKQVDLYAKDRQQRNALELLLDKETGVSDSTVYESLKLLDHHGLDVHLRGRQDLTALHLLCKNYQKEDIVDVLKFLIETKGIDVNVKDGDGRTALHWLCENCKTEKIIPAMNFLIEKGADLSHGQYVIQCLYFNYTNEHIVDAMKLLIEKGVDINWNDCSGRTALHHLCSTFKNRNIVGAMDLLIEKGVAVEQINIHGQTALHLLCFYYKNENIIDAIKLLVEKGADVNSKDERELTALRYLCGTYDKENIVDAIKFFFDNSFQCTGTMDVQNALCILFQNEKRENIIDTMKFLIEKGFDVKSWKDYSYKWTALHYLCRYYEKENIAEAMEFLIDHGVDVNWRDRLGRTALDYLCRHYENENIVGAMELLIEKGFMMDEVSKLDLTPAVRCLFYNVNSKTIISALKLLIEKARYDVKLQDKYGRTALLWLCANYNKGENIVEAMKFLIDKGVDAKLKDQIGWTALHWLCQNYKNKENFVSAFEFLVDNGVDVNGKDKDGISLTSYIEWNWKLDEGNKERCLEILTKKIDRVGIQ